MKAHLSICPIGVFACDDTGKIIDKELFEKNSERVAQKILQLRAGKIIPELKTLYERASKNYDEITLENENNFGLQVETAVPNLCGKVLRQQVNDLARQFGFPSLEKFVHLIALTITAETLQVELSRPDKRIIQVVGALEELEENTNVLSERLREWYLLFYPEFIGQVDKHDSFARIVSKGKVEKKESIGADFNDNDLNTVRFFAENIAGAFSLNEALENYLNGLMKQHFPNLHAVAGSIIGAKLLAIAGDSKRLARMPSSTIQVLGAEKALFRHLKEGTKSPKYGVILKHTFIQSTPQRLRGKVARSLAAKISIAVRTDIYSKEFVGDKLRKDLEMKVARIKGSGKYEKFKPKKF